MSIKIILSQLIERYSDLKISHDRKTEHYVHLVDSLSGVIELPNDADILHQNRGRGN